MYGPTPGGIPTYTTESTGPGLTSDQVIQQALAATQNLDYPKAQALRGELSPAYQSLLDEELSSPLMGAALKQREQQRQAALAERTGFQAQQNMLEIAKALVQGQYDSPEAAIAAFTKEIYSTMIADFQADPDVLAGKKKFTPEIDKVMQIKAREAANQKYYNILVQATTTMAASNTGRPVIYPRGVPGEQ